MTVLLDLNVVLDTLLGREPWRAEADAIWDANRDKQIDGRMSAAALSTQIYIVRKQDDLALGLKWLFPSGVGQAFLPDFQIIVHARKAGRPRLSNNS